MPFVPTFPTQSLRGLGAYPTQPLRGLGATVDPLQQALIQKAKSDFIAACEELTAGTKKACDKIRSNATLLGGARTREVCSRIEANVKQGCDRLRQVDNKGEPFFLRHPDKARDLLALIQKNADDDIQEHKQLMIDTGHTRLFGDFGFDSLKEFIKQVIDKLFEILQFIIVALLRSATKFPVTAVALAAAAAAVVWFKFLR